MDIRGTSREGIVDAALEVFLQDGVAGMSMRKVADAAGITAPAIYRHFQNREVLLGEIVEIGLRELEKYLRPALKSGTPYERVRQLADRYLDFALEQPKYFDVASLNAGTRIEWLSQELAHPMWDVFRAAIAQIELGMERGHFRRDNPISTAILIWATAHGLVTLYRIDRTAAYPKQFREIYRASMDRLFQGLRPLETSK
jgi:AcrR family transcriptional regulator